MRSPPRPDWTVATVRAHADRTFAVFVDLWQQAGDDMPPVAVLYTPDGEAVAVPDLEDFPKEALPGIVRRAAEVMEAAYVLFACGATCVETNDPERMAVWKATGRPLREHPDAVDCLFLSVDGPGISIGMRAFRDKEGNVRTDYIDNGAITGTMTNLSGRLGEN